MASPTDKSSTWILLSVIICITLGSMLACHRSAAVDDIHKITVAERFLPEENPENVAVVLVNKYFDYLKTDNVSSWVKLEDYKIQRIEIKHLDESIFPEYKGKIIVSVWYSVKPSSSSYQNWYSNYSGGDYPEWLNQMTTCVITKEAETYKLQDVAPVL